MNFNAFCLERLGVSPESIQKDILTWLEEDQGLGDPLLFLGSFCPRAHFQVIAKETFQVCGLPILAQVLQQACGFEVNIVSSVQDGETIEQGGVLLEGEGPSRGLLLGERTSLNIFAKLCGIATKTWHVRQTLPPHVQLLETRKTTPGLRRYEKYATRVGGARNHRHTLSSGAMLKENHIRLLGGVERALNVTKKLPLLMGSEVEVTNLEEFSQALKSDISVIMLDNFSFEEVKEAVALKALVARPVFLELSGNLDEKNLTCLPEGIDFISMGALIHKAVWVDVSFQLIPA